MCDCHEKISKVLEKKILETIAKEARFAGITSAGFENEVILMTGSGPKVPIVIPFVVEYHKRAKASGKLRIHKEKVNYMPSFCPSCGEKYGSELPQIRMSFEDIWEHVYPMYSKEDELTLKEMCKVIHDLTLSQNKIEAYQEPTKNKSVQGRDCLAIPFEISFLDKG